MGALFVIDFRTCLRLLHRRSLLLVFRLRKIMAAFPPPISDASSSLLRDPDSPMSFDEPYTEPGPFHTMREYILVHSPLRISGLGSDLGRGFGGVTR